MTTRTFDDAVIGAGVVGLAIAYQLASRGRRVVVLERHPRPRGASVRNFGMLWPIGQPAGPLRALAMQSRKVWLDVLTGAGIWHEQSGSLHLAYQEDEARVLREFQETSAGTGFPCELVETAHVREYSPAVSLDGLRLALWSPNEVCVDPRSVSTGLMAWLTHHLGVVFEVGVQVTRCVPPRVESGSQAWEAERVWICAGDDLQTLFPRELSELGLLRTKLQMMRSRPVGFRLGPMLAAGLTLRHYAAFRKCPSLPALERRLNSELSQYVRFGVHVMVSQNGLGELTIGDSHEYGDEIEPFDKPAVDALILDYLGRFLRIGPTEIQSRWHGYYVKHPSQPYAIVTPAEGAMAITGLGGHGMTLSFGLAERVVSEALQAHATSDYSGRP